jgi:hypothetical protein
MKLRFALIALATLGGAALSAGTASAMPVAPLGTNASNVETVALSAVPAVVSAPVPAYRHRAVVVRRPYVARGYYRRGYRRY